MQMGEQQDVQECRNTLKKGTMFVQTVHGNYEGFTKQEVLKAQEVRKAQAMLGNPSKKDFQGLVSGDLIPNCPIARTNITKAHKNLGQIWQAYAEKQCVERLHQWWETMWQSLGSWWKLIKQ
jgi:hypothetical protein